MNVFREIIDYISDDFVRKFEELSQVEILTIESLSR